MIPRELNLILTFEKKKFNKIDLQQREEENKNRRVQYMYLQHIIHERYNFFNDYNSSSEF
jgi:hypothetical protein